MELELSRLMAEDEPETEEARDSLYARIREIRAELMRLKESFPGLKRSFSMRRGEGFGRATFPKRDRGAKRKAAVG